jgi:uncharacterized protein
MSTAGPEKTATGDRRVATLDGACRDEGRKAIRDHGRLPKMAMSKRFSMAPFEKAAAMNAQQQYARALQLARRADRNGGPLPLRLLQESAAAGYPPALHALASWYLHGKGVRKSFKKAVSLLRIAAKKNYAAAEYDLAVSYELGTGVRKNFKAAALYYRRAAKNGDPDAPAEVARCFFYGIGTAKNRVKALQWYLKAAKQGNAESEFALGRAHELGDGTEKDIRMAVVWYRRAAEHGDPDAAAAIRDLETRIARAG